MREVVGALDKANETLAELNDESWRAPAELPPDQALPVPRLELLYEHVDGWREHVVHYRLVIRHYVDCILAIPLGKTKRSRGSNETPNTEDLPLRDGYHIKHDARELGLPAFQVVPGKRPAEIIERLETAHPRNLAFPSQPE